MTDLRIIQPACETCGLQGKKKVWGVGPDQCDLVIVGEAPGRDEERKGEPFVGDSGKLLKGLLSQMEMDPAKIFITNVCLCRPPDNRDPSKHEMDCCSARLQSEVLARNPKKILLLGSVASQSFLGERINKVKSRYHKWKGIDVLATLHPAFVLRTPSTFRDFVRDVDKWVHKEPKPQVELEYTVYGEEDEEKVVTYLRGLHSYEVSVDVAVDIETSSFSPYLDRFICIGLGSKLNPGHTYILEEPLLRKSNSVRLLLQSLGWYANVVCQNGDFEYRWLKYKFGIELKISFDTMLAHYSLDERAGGDEFGMEAHGLKVLGGYYCDYPDWEENLKPYHGDYGKVPKEMLYKYLCYDIQATLNIKEPLEAEMKADGVYEVFKNVMMPALPVLGDMSVQGIHADWPYLCGPLETKMERLINIRRLGLEKEFLGYSFTVDEKKGTDPVRSSKKMANLIYDVLGLPEVKGKGRGTGEKVLKELADITGNKQVQKISDLRSSMVQLNTFVKGMQDLIVPSDGKIHAGFLIHGTETGRLSSRGPNMQNIPATGRYKAWMRGIFIAEEGWEFLDVDYKALEMRILAVFTRDLLLNEYLTDTSKDIHAEFAAIFFDIPLSKVTNDHRKIAKTVVFGVMYGRSAHAIAKMFGVPLSRAKGWVATLRARCPAIAQFEEECQRGLYEDGCVRTLYGRQRRFPLLLPQNIAEYKRQAVNAPIQGTASDLCLTSLTRIAGMVDKTVCRPLLTIHDGLLFEIRTEVFEENASLIVKEMQKIPESWNTSLPFPVDAKRGTRWGHLKEYEVV